MKLLPRARLAAIVALVAVALIPVAGPPAQAVGDTAADPPVVEGAPVGGSANGGYLMAADDGSVHTFKPASRGSTPEVGRPGGRPVVDIAATPSGEGYWLTTTHGDVYSFGDARFYGSTGSLALNRPIVGMAGSPTGRGYWLVASDGGIFTFGDARFYGSTGDIRLNQPIVGMASSPTGAGYWLVAADGGIFTYGDATFRGSTGNLRLNKPIVGMASTPSGMGYWMVASDGGIFTYGDGCFYGSAGGLRLRRPIVGMSPTPTGQGYWLAASDGGVFTYGDAVFQGAMESSLLDGRIVGLVPQGGDVRAPVLHELSFGPRVVDTGEGEAHIRFRARIRDDITGFKSAGITFKHPSGQEAVVGWDWFTRVSGDAMDGVYVGVLTLPKNAAQGRWTVSELAMYDQVGNPAKVQARTLAEAGYDTSFEQVARGDSEPPRLQSLSVTPTVIDTSNGPATVTVRVRVTDDWTGVNTGSMSVRFNYGVQSNEVRYADWRLVSGDARDGVYEAPIRFPAGSAQGFWPLTFVFLRDFAGNSHFQYKQDLTGLDVTPGLNQTGPGDASPPQLVSLSISPTLVDTSSQPAQVTITARVTDPGVGFIPVGDDVWGGGSISFQSPSQQEVGGGFSAGNLISGDTHDGVYQSTITIPVHSEQGTWRVRWMNLTDRVGNQGVTYGQAMASAGFPTTFEVLRTEDVQVRP